MYNIIFLGVKQIAKGLTAHAPGLVTGHYFICMGVSQLLHPLTPSTSSGQQLFVWSKIDTFMITTSTSQLIVMSTHYEVIAKALDNDEE